MGVEEDVRLAQQFIAQDPGPPEERYALALRLSAVHYFTHARKVLRQANIADADTALRYNIQRKLALFTYKDQDEPAEERLNEAQKMLEALLSTEAPSEDPDLRQDVFGILGAVHKRRWELDGKREHLAKACQSYEAGYKLGRSFRFYGYTAVNAAFVKDLLAEIDDNSLVAYADSNREKLHDDAEIIRRELIEVFGDKSEKTGEDRYWDCVTLGEAHLGIGAYQRACEWMVEAAKVPVETWKVETTARQIAQLARLEYKKRPGEAPPDKAGPRKVLQALLGGDGEAAASFLRGKVGMALSGGGFRASFFHIGLLAKLAEMDLLRHIEVISCVSGGSILGVHYYLELQQLLNTIAEPTHADYIRLVQRLERNFLAGVQRNIRLRVLLHPMSTIRLVRRESSTTHRLGEFYEREIYSRVADGNGLKPRYMDDLKVTFPDNQSFNPKYDNWRRSAKVPILVLNATTLNTCHSWQFTATTMGEPPQCRAENQIDANERLRRLWYSEAPEAFRHVRLGHAVAASACVPGLFDPLALDKLYDGRITKLVDGGVFDNQGVASLLEQGCTQLLVSDASGQTGIEMDPKSSTLAVPVRANNILMARVRQSQYQLIDALRSAGVIHDLAFVHLKKGLQGPSVNWRGCTDRSDVMPENLRTDYGVRRDVQRLLAGIRTDLDSFSDIEADALMFSGYRMMEKEVEALEGFPNAAPPATPDTLWRFMRVEPFVGGTDLDSDEKSRGQLRRTLEAAHCEAFKTFRLIPGYGRVAQALKWLTIASAIFVSWHAWDMTDRLAGIAPAHLSRLALLIIGAAVLARILRWWRRGSPAWHYVLGLISLTVGWLYLLLHLQVLDRIYLRSGPKYRKQYPDLCRTLEPQSTDTVAVAGQ